MKKYENATDAAVSYVSRRDRTEQEVRNKLAEYGFSSDDTDEAITALRDSLLLNDEEFARELVRTKLAVPHSLRTLRMKLRERLVSEDIIDSVLGDLDTDYENAYEESFSFLHNAMRSDADPQKLRQKLYRRLISHGYSYDTARSAIDAAEAALTE